VNHINDTKRIKPKGLREVTLLMCVSSSSLALWIDGSTTGSRGGDLAYYGSIAAISFVALWFFWQGRNWARILVLLTSVLSVIAPLIPVEETPLQRAITVMDAALGVFLLYWLNTKPVKQYFKPVQAITPHAHDSSVPPIPEP
jgi:hypothetical protein